MELVTGGSLAERLARFRTDCRRPTSPGSGPRWRRHSLRPTRPASSTATSSRRTCCSTTDGDAKLADFGIARRLDEIERVADVGRHGHGHPPLRVARAGPRRAARPGERRLLARRDAVRGRHRRSSAVGARACSRTTASTSERSSHRSIRGWPTRSPTRRPSRRGGALSDRPGDGGRARVDRIESAGAEPPSCPRICSTAGLVRRSRRRAASPPAGPDRRRRRRRRRGRPRPRRRTRTWGLPRRQRHDISAGRAHRHVARPSPTSARHHRGSDDRGTDDRGTDHGGSDPRLRRRRRR